MKKVIIFGLLIHLVVAVRSELKFAHFNRSLWDSAATTIPGLFYYMIGKSPKFTRFKCHPFSFPKQIYLPDCQIKNERDFIEFLLRNDWVQKILGIKMPGSNGFFPDVKGEIYDGSGDKIKVEIEYRAENYAMHGHAFSGCDLILSFLKSPEIKFVKGVPVWSFYESYKKENYGILSIYSDIKFDFLNYNPNEDGVINKPLKKSHPCDVCGKPIYNSISKICSFECIRLYAKTQIAKVAGG